MRHLLIASLFILFSFGVGALADNTANGGSEITAPQCMPVVLDQKTTTACFNLSDNQVQSLDTNTILLDNWRRCKDRCYDRDIFGRCRRWHRVCW